MNASSYVGNTRLPAILVMTIVSINGTSIPKAGLWFSFTEAVRRACRGSSSRAPPRAIRPWLMAEMPATAHACSVTSAIGCSVTSPIGTIGSRLNIGARNWAGTILHRDPQNQSAAAADQFQRALRRILKHEYKGQCKAHTAVDSGI